MTLIFWVSLTVLIYIYIGYPLLVWICARVWGRLPQRSSILPLVSLVIPAYNEALYIEGKLRNSLNLDYPKDRLEVVVASDGSTDETEAIVKRFRPFGVRLVSMVQNIGKSAMLNRVMGFLSGEIVVFSDASTELAANAIRFLMRSFADPKVGCVSGKYHLKQVKDLRSQGEGLYWRYETFIKEQESRLHSILGAHGACYAIRKRLFQPLENASINDDYLIPMRIVAQGYRAVYEPEAMAWEEESTSMEGEFSRRRRIAAGNCQQIVALRSLLSLRHGWVVFCFFSHKVLRSFAPVFLGILILSSFGLPNPWRFLSLAFQSLFYASAWVGYYCQKRGYPVKWLSPSLYFCLGNLATLAGLIRYFLGRKRLIWERAR